MRQTVCLYLVLVCFLVSPAFGAEASKSDLDVHIRFCEKSEVPKAFGSKGFPWKFKEWTSAEKTIMTSVWPQIREKAPGLVTAAACGSTLFLVRADSLYVDKYPQKIPGGPPGPSSAAGEDYVIFGDQYFEDKYAYYRPHGLAHELVHMVDYGDYLSYSPEWTKFAESKIIKYLDQYKAQKSENRSSFVALNLESGNCPSAYGSSDLREAFAEFFVASKFEKFDAGTFYKTHFEDSFLPVSQRRLDFRKHFCAGNKARYEEKYEEALKEYKIAEGLAPNAPTLQVRLANVYQAQKDYERCFKSSAKALRFLQENGVSEQDSNYQYVEKEGEWAYAYFYHEKFPKNNMSTSKDIFHSSRRN